MDLQLYQRVNSRPPPQDLSVEKLATPEQRKIEKVKEVSSAFLKYLADTEVFASWKDKEIFRETHVSVKHIWLVEY
jgi:hypothetical protein